MKEFFVEHQNAIMRWLGIGAVIWLIHRISKIFKGEDGKFQVKEFCQMSAFLIFTTLACYMIWKEANRDHEWPLFDGFYIFIVFGALLSVLHLDHAITNITKILELFLKLRTKVPAQDKKEEVS